MDLSRKPRAPASIARRISMSPWYVESMLMRASSDSEQRAIKASIPLMSGRRTSISVISGLKLRNCRMPSSPSAACATNSMSACASIIAATPSRNSGWSSTVRMRMRAVVAVMSVLLSLRLIAANTSSRDARQHAHAAWKLSEATLRGYPRSLAQTIDGYLWIGTEFGLVRFDGLHFVPWIAPKGTTLPSEVVTTLRAARDGGLWIGTTAGLAHWTGHSLIVEPALAKSHISALIE